MSAAKARYGLTSPPGIRVSRKPHVRLSCPQAGVVTPSQPEDTVVSGTGIVTADFGAAARGVALAPSRAWGEAELLCALDLTAEHLWGDGATGEPSAITSHRRGAVASSQGSRWSVARSGRSESPLQPLEFAIA